MKSYELKPTRENFMETLLSDTLERNKDVFWFADILNSLEDSCSVAIDGSWGSGKTFFVNQVKIFLDANNGFYGAIDSAEKVAILTEWKRFYGNCEPEYQPHVSVYYDAWENDNDEDPVLSLIYTILKNVNDGFSISNNAGFINIAANILEFFKGKNWSALIDGFRSNDPLDQLKKEKAIEAEISRFLDALLEERGNRLVVFIDELDRCKPSYAVRLLERIKHYFSNDRITFVFSINTNELQHTIKRYYGAEFDACRYLDRFFDLRISLPPVNLDVFYRSIDFNNHKYIYDNMCHAVICRYNFSLREVAKYLRLAKMAAYDVTHNNAKNNLSTFFMNKATRFCLFYIIPIMLGLKIGNTNQYDNFINGHDSSPLLEFVDVNERMFSVLLETNETYTPCNDNSKVVTITEKLQQVYDAIFRTTYGESLYEKTVGECEFNKRTKEFILRTASLFSEFTCID